MGFWNPVLEGLYSNWIRQKNFSSPYNDNEDGHLLSDEVKRERVFQKKLNENWEGICHSKRNKVTFNRFSNEHAVEERNITDPSILSVSFSPVDAGVSNFAPFSTCLLSLLAKWIWLSPGLDCGVLVLMEWHPSLFMTFILLSSGSLSKLVLMARFGASESRRLCWFGVILLVFGFSAESTSGMRHSWLRVFCFKIIHRWQSLGDFAKANGVNLGFADGPTVPECVDVSISVEHVGTGADPLLVD